MSLMLIYQALYFLAKLFVGAFKRILHYIDGTTAHRNAIQNGSESSGLVAEVYRVITRLPGMEMSVADDVHFLCWHEKFVTVDYLLKPNVTLYFVDSSRAVFVECPPDINIYDTRRFPFYFIAQRLNCTKKIVVPISELSNIAKKIGEPKCQVGWVFHMARCGSTTVAQGLNAVPDCVVISESQDMLVHLTAVGTKEGVDLDDYLASSTFNQILSSAITFLLKDFTSSQLVCVKTTASLNYVLMPRISTLFPSHRLMSMHRDGIATAKSFWKMANQYTVLKFGVFCMRNFPRIFSRPRRTFILIFSNTLISEVEHFFYGEFNIFVFMYIQWVTNIVIFQRNVKKLKDKKVFTIFYDDFQSNKPGVMQQLFAHLDISEDYIELALKAMENDSQAGTPLSWEHLKGLEQWTRDEQTVTICNKVLKQFNLPDFDQKFRFNNQYEVELI